MIDRRRVHAWASRHRFSHVSSFHQSISGGKTSFPREGQTAAGMRLLVLLKGTSAAPKTHDYEQRYQPPSLYLAVRVKRGGMFRCVCVHICFGVLLCVCWAPTESPSLCCVGGSLPNQGSLHEVSAGVSRERRGDQSPD